MIMLRNDEIIAVDGMEIYPDTIQDAIVGDDIDGSMVTLTVRKEHTGNIFDVQIKRVSKRSMQPMVELLEQVDLLMKRYSETEVSTGIFAGRHIDHIPSTASVVTKIRSLISKIILER